MAWPLNQPVLDVELIWLSSNVLNTRPKPKKATEVKIERSLVYWPESFFSFRCRKWQFSGQITDRKRSWQRIRQSVLCRVAFLHWALPVVCQSEEKIAVIQYPINPRFDEWLSVKHFTHLSGGVERAKGLLIAKEQFLELPLVLLLGAQMSVASRKIFLKTNP